MTWQVANDIAERLADLRQALGLSQRELALRAGVRPQQVSNWEAGRQKAGGQNPQKPPRSRLEAWAKREGWPVEMFSEGGPMPSTVVNRLVQPSNFTEATGTPYGAPPYQHTPYALTKALEVFEAEIALAKAKGEPIPRDKVVELIAMLHAAINGPDGDHHRRKGDAVG